MRQATLKSKSRLVGVAYVGGPLALLGPAFVAAVAYIDPGNFATNITAEPRDEFCVRSPDASGPCRWLCGLTHYTAATTFC